MAAALVCSKCGNTDPDLFTVEERGGPMLIYVVLPKSTETEKIQIAYDYATKSSSSAFYLRCEQCTNDQLLPRDALEEGAIIAPKPTREKLLKLNKVLWTRGSNASSDKV